MWQRASTVSGGGGSAIETEVCGYAYNNSYYYFGIFNTKTGGVNFATMYYSGTATPKQLSGSLLKVERTGGHSFKWTAMNGAYLYRLGYNDSGGVDILPCGQNGTYSTGNTYSNNVTMIATVEQLSY